MTRLKQLPVEFIFPVLIVMSLDLIFTIVGQPARYWVQFSNAVEGSPTRFLLEIHPLLFILPFIGYLCLVFFLLKKLPLKIGMPLAISLFLAHAWGSSSWIYSLCKRAMGFTLANLLHWYFVLVYLIILSVIASVFIWKYLNKKR